MSVGQSNSSFSNRHKQISPSIFLHNFKWNQTIMRLIYFPDLLIFFRYWQIISIAWLSKYFQNALIEIQRQLKNVMTSLMLPATLKMSSLLYLEQILRTIFINDCKWFFRSTFRFNRLLVNI